MSNISRLFFEGCVFLAAITGCIASPLCAEVMDVQGESLVLAKAEPGNLCFNNVVKGSLTLRSTFVAGKQGEIVYNEGSDYIIDYAKGTITRTANSRIPDYSTNCLYGAERF